MKFANFVFGLVIFSIVSAMMFSAVQSYLTKNPGAQDPDEWGELSAGYNVFVANISNQPNSMIREIDDQSELGAAKSEDNDVTIISGAISGGRLIKNSLFNFDEMIAKVSGDTTTGGNFINPNIFNAITALVVIFLILVTLHFLRGFKTEI